MTTLSTSLHALYSGDKEALKAKREEILLKAAKKENDTAVQREEKKKEYSKHALKKAMDVWDINLFIAFQLLTTPQTDMIPLVIIIEYHS